MIDILVQIISNLTAFSGIKALEIGLAIGTFLVLAATLYYLRLYTESTQKLQMAAENQTAEIIRQRILSTLPSLHFKISKSGDGWTMFYLVKNLGNGAALNITLRITFYLDDGRSFEAIGMSPSASHDGIEADINFNNTLQDEIHRVLNNYQCEFQFQNVEGQWHKQISFVRDGIYHSEIAERIEKPFILKV